MKIIQVIPVFKLAGAETMCANLLYELKNQGHDVLAVSLYSEKTSITDEIEKSGIRILFLNKRAGFDLLIFNKLNKIFKDEKPDVVHTHICASRYALPVAVYRKVKCIVHTVHNVAKNEQTNVGRRINSFFFKKRRVVPVALSDLIRKSVEDEYRLEFNQIPVVYNGIDLNKCIPKANYTVTGNFKILHIGRFSEQKNHAGLLEAFNLLHKKHADTELWLIGDGEEREETAEYVQKNGLEGYVKFLGLQSNVYPFLHDADVFTLPSNYEGIPMTIIEAMGTGLPIVATAVGGVRDMLTDNVSALLVDNTPQLIADAFENYYLNEDLRITHGECARMASVKFSAQSMAEEYAKIYSNHV